MNPHSHYLIPCPCGKLVATHEPETTCPDCGRELIVDVAQRANPPATQEALFAADEAEALDPARFRNRLGRKAGR